MQPEDPVVRPGVIGIEAERQVLSAQSAGGWGLMGAHRWVAVLDGSGQVELASGLSAVSPGDVLLIRADTRYRFTADGPGMDMAVLRLRSRALAPNQAVDRLAAEVVTAAAALAQRHGGHLRLSPDGRQAVYQALCDLVALTAAAGPATPLALKARLLQLLHVLAGEPRIRRRLGQADRSLPGETSGIKLLLQHIDEHFDEPLTVIQAMAIADLGRTRFHQAFRRATGQSFTAYLTRYRIGQAAALLRHSRRDILDIAYSCGFGSISRFYDTFGREMGLSPQRYRRG